MEVIGAAGVIGKLELCIVGTRVSTRRTYGAPGS